MTGQAKPSSWPGASRKRLLHEFEDFPRHRIWFAAEPRRSLGSILPEALPIVRVEVPGAALRLPLVGQEHSEPASHPAVEVVHDQGLAARGPVFELRRLDQKVWVLEQLELCTKSVCRLLNGLQSAEVSGPEDQQPGRPERLPGAL